MKKVFLILAGACLTLAALCVVATAQAQTKAQAQTPDAPTIKLTGNTQAEILGLLEMMGAHALRFDTGELSDGRYRFVPFIEEYEGGEKVEDKNSFRMVMTQDWRDKPADEEAWNRITARYEPRMSADGTKFLKPLDGIGVTVIEKNDSLTVAKVDVYGLGANYMYMKLRPLPNIEKMPGYAYGYKPFKIVASGERKQRIPLMLAGSFWWDEKAKVHRFCTVNEFAPDLSDKDIALIPHYYVIGIEIERIE